MSTWTNQALKEDAPSIMYDEPNVEYDDARFNYIGQLAENWTNQTKN